MSYSTRPFTDLVEVNPRVYMDRGDEHPFVDMAAITPGERYVSAGEWRPYKGGGAKFESGDTLFARITPCLENGKIAQYAGTAGVSAFGSTEFWVFRAKPDVADPDFVFYLARTDLVRKPAEGSMSGASGRQRADIAVLSDLHVPAPPLEVQRRIAGILSAYDNLIGNNTRRIAILEEMAKAIYREWFVNFRFPGHEQVEMVESELGRVPAGWAVGPVTEAIEFNPRTPVPAAGEKPFVPMGCISTSSMLIEGVETRSGNSGSKFRNGDTLFARITPCLENGKTGYVQFLPTPKDVAFGSTEFIVLRSRTLCPEIVYLMARSAPFRDHAIKSMSGATGRQRVQEAAFAGYRIAQPDQATVHRFSELVAPQFRMIQVLAERNSALRRSRDLLLPRLMSGEIEASAVEEAFAGMAS